MALRINFIDVIVDNSLKRITTPNKSIVGFQFDIFLSNYRGHFLSCINTFEVKIDNEIIDNSIVRFCINEKEFPLSDLKYLRSEFWKLNDKATIKVIDLGELSNSEHLVEVIIELRVPYMPIPIGDHNYVPLDSSGKKKLMFGGDSGE